MWQAEIKGWHLTRLVCICSVVFCWPICELGRSWGEGQSSPGGGLFKASHPHHCTALCCWRLISGLDPPVVSLDSGHLRTSVSALDKLFKRAKAFDFGTSHIRFSAMLCLCPSVVSLSWTLKASLHWEPQKWATYWIFLTTKDIKEINQPRSLIKGQRYEPYYYHKAFYL